MFLYALFSSGLYLEADNRTLKSVVSFNVVLSASILRREVRCLLEVKGEIQIFWLFPRFNCCYFSFNVKCHSLSQLL